MKNIVLIRHGESLGQTANKRGMSRKDESLADCFLTRKGVHQALALRSNAKLSSYNFDLVCTSPLTRAVATCALGMGNLAENDTKSSRDGVRVTRFVAHASISEAGTGIPENRGREIQSVKEDLKRKLSRISPPSLACIDQIDFSLLPESWPQVGESGSSAKKRKLDLFLEWLLTQRREQTIAIFCHWHIIRWLLGDQIDHVPNCMPIECVLLDTARLVLKSRKYLYET